MKEFPSKTHWRTVELIKAADNNAHMAMQDFTDKLKVRGMESPAKSQILLVRGEKITSKICDFAARKPILYSAWRLHSHMRQRYRP